MAFTSRSALVRRPVATMLAPLLLGLTALGCTGEEAVPIDPANPPTTVPDLTEVTHQIEPTEQMVEVAEQQCRDDPTLVEGYVRAVDPETDQVLAEVTADCDEVRAGN